MAVIGYSGYLIDAAQLASLTKTVADIENYAAREKQARDFVATMRSHIATALEGGYDSVGVRYVLDDFINILTLTRVSSTEVSNVTNAINIIKKYLDDTVNYPSASKNARQIGLAIVTTLRSVTPEMLYAGMVT
jgi:acetoin utilization deacetylase AcuC-like enzyme